MAEPDAVMKRIGDGIELSQRGERDRARRVFAQVWHEIGGDAGAPLYRCAIAHSLADLQDDPRDELVWDLRALAAADSISDDEATRAGVPGPVAGFYASLHLNLGECYRKLGDRDRAREHLRRGQAAIDAVADNGYGRMIEGGLGRLEERLRPRAPQTDGALPGPGRPRSLAPTLDEDKEAQL